LATDTLPEPWVARSSVVKFTIICDELTNVVSRGLPFQFATAVGAKFVPAILTVKGPIVPAVVLGGVNEVIAGAPLGTGFTTNVSAFELPPGSGFTTVICTEEFALATSAAAIVISSWLVELFNAVGREVPSKKPTDDLLNPVPLMKRVNESLPAVMSPGEIVEMIGVALGPGPLLEHPQTKIPTNARTATKLHRERVKQFLLRSFRAFRGRSGRAERNARKTEATPKLTATQPLN